MVIRVNGEAKTLNHETMAVENLLSLCNVESPDFVSVQLNGKFLSKDRFASTHLKENDEVDFLYFLGGGR
jgi:sulfur carrier protein